MASTAGRPELPWPGPRLVTALMTVLSSCTRHGPASGSSGASLQGHVPIMPLGPARDAMGYQIRRLVSDPDDTHADLPGPGATFRAVEPLGTIGRVPYGFDPLLTGK
jgi:hypothetical protein